MSIMRLDTYLTVSGRSRQSVLKTPHCAKRARKHPTGRQLLHKVGNLAISIVVGMATIATTIGAVSVTTAAQSEAASVTTSTPTPSWSIEQSYPAAIEYINDVSCTSTSFCMVVGSNLSSNYMASSYNGTTWNNYSFPSGPPTGGFAVASYFTGVSCSTASFCMAVGADPNGNVAFLYNGSSWTQVSFPNSTYTSMPDSISCTSSSFCMAIGGDSGAMAFLYNGSSWKEESLPSGIIGSSHSNDISCASPTFCMAVWVSTSGSTGITTAAVLSYNGSTWKQVSFPSGVSLYSISCVSSSFCMAAGDNSSNGTVVLSYNGSTWKQVSLPSGITLGSVSCPTITFCMAAGDNSSNNTVVLSYNGSSWTQVSFPSGVSLYSISCVSSSFCMAAGDNSSNGTVALSYNGSTWKQVSLPSGMNIGSISCASSSFCVTIAGNSSNNTVVLSYNGSTWTQSPLSSNAGLAGMSCSLEGICSLLEEGTNSLTNNFWVAFSYNGSTWTQSPSFTGNIALDDISCTSISFCMAVGADVDGSSVALSYNGSTWTQDILPYGGSNLYGISCASVSFCVAIGYNVSSDTMALSYNGSTWTQDSLPSNIGTDNSSLRAVSCISTDFCRIVASTPNHTVILAAPALKAPTISSVTPSSSPTTGGGTVTISGTHFGSGTTVSFGQYALSGSAVTVNSSSSITVKVPPVSSPGMVEISVTTPIGTSNDTGFVYVDTNLSYIPVTPFRIADTRCSTDPPPSFCASENLPQANKNLSSPLAGHSITIQVTGTGIGSDEITSSAQSVVATITAIANNNANNGYLSVYPAGTAPPTASSLNYTAAMTIPNLITATLGKGGAIDIFSSSSNVNITVDIEGYYVPSGSDTQTPANRFTPLPSPIRVLDTRCSTTPKPSYCAAENIPAVNQISAASPDSYIKLKVAGISSIPISATAISLVVTAAGSLSGGYLSVYPTSSSAAPPDTSNVNFHRAVASADSAIVEVGQSGYISIYNSANTPTNVIVDINGYFYSSGDGFSPSSPIRICDTRSQTTIGGKDVVSGLTGQCNNSGVPLDPSLSALLLDPITVQVTGIAGITSTAKVVVANITVVNTGGAGYLTAFPAGTTMPPTSNINWGKGQIMPNMVTAALSPKGQMEIYCSSSCDVVVDVVGWYS